MNFNLLYLILQKDLGQSRESHLNTRCQRPANRIPELCAPITRAHLRSRDPFTHEDPTLPMPPWWPQFRAPRWHLPVPDPRARSDRAQAASADPEATPRGRGAAPLRGDWRGAGKGGLRAHGAPTAPRPPWGPGVLTLRPVAATPEPRTE